MSAYDAFYIRISNRPPHLLVYNQHAGSRHIRLIAVFGVLVSNTVENTVRIAFKMPHAIAKVGDHVIAETDSWETVEGNIYVCR